MKNSNPHKDDDKLILRQIYQITFLMDGRTYIGKHTPKKNEDFHKYYGSGKHITRAIQKYGKENFKKEILFEAICTESFIAEKEKFYIAEARKIGKAEFNISAGGDGGCNPNTHTSEKWIHRFDNWDEARWELFRNRCKESQNSLDKETKVAKMKETLKNLSKEQILKSHKLAAANRGPDSKSSHKGCHWKQRPEALIKRWKRYIENYKAKGNFKKVIELENKIRNLQESVES